MKPKYIIIHHSLTKDGKTVSWDAIRSYHVQELEMIEIGYQFGIELVNSRHEIFVGRMMNEIGAHTKQDRMNFQSIGICFVGNFDYESPSDEQWNLGLRLVRSLIDIFKISKDRVFGHNHFAKYKTCPGKLFDVKKFRELL